MILCSLILSNVNFFRPILAEKPEIIVSTPSKAVVHLEAKVWKRGWIKIGIKLTRGIEYGFDWIAGYIGH